MIPKRRLAITGARACLAKTKTDLANNPRFFLTLDNRPHSCETSLVRSLTRPAIPLIGLSVTTKIDLTCLKWKLHALASSDHDHAATEGQTPSIIHPLTLNTKLLVASPHLLSIVHRPRPPPPQSSSTWKSFRIFRKSLAIWRNVTWVQGSLLTSKLEFFYMVVFPKIEGFFYNTGCL